MKRRPLLVLFIAHVVLLSGIFVIINLLYYFSPGELERQIALKILSGEIPYRDFTSEYPPLALLSFLIPGIFFRTSLAYFIAFAAEMLVFDLIALVLIRSLADRFKIPVWHALGIYTLFIIAVGPLVIGRYDIIPTVLVLAALWAFIRGNQKIAWIILALGIMAKVYPVIIAPLFAITYLKQGQIRTLIRHAVMFGAVIAALSLPWMMMNSKGFLETFLYHADRGLQWESSYASILLVGQMLHLTEVTSIFNFGSWNVASSPLADTLTRLSTYITIGLLIIVYILYARKLLKNKLSAEEQAGGLLSYSCLALLAFMLSNKVFSAQYIIWLCPLLPLVAGQNRTSLWILFGAAAAITQYLFPYNYVLLELAPPFLVILLAGRNLFLGLMAILLIFPEPRRESEKSRALLEKAD